MSQGTVRPSRAPDWSAVGREPGNPIVASSAGDGKARYSTVSGETAAIPHIAV
jgi:hypothetical protein